jgi:hypothetical protein
VRRWTEDETRWDETRWDACDDALKRLLGAGELDTSLGVMAKFPAREIVSINNRLYQREKWQEDPPILQDEQQRT